MRTMTWCALPSPELTVTRTARNAGAETVCGSSRPPDRIENVAGTRTFVEPPVCCRFPWPRLEPPPLTGAPPLAGAVVVWPPWADVVPDAVVVGALVVVDPLVAPPAVVVVAVPAPVGDVAGAVLDPPCAVEEE